MHTSYRSRTLGSRGVRPRRVLRPVAGQCFEITISPEGNRWLVRIPEIDQSVEVAARAEAEPAARECVATHTGIPIGYISVWVRD